MGLTDNERVEVDNLHRREAILSQQLVCFSCSLVQYSWVQVDSIESPKFVCRACVCALQEDWNESCILTAVMPNCMIA